jgi:hypothetical protein
VEKQRSQPSSAAQNAATAQQDEELRVLRVEKCRLEAALAKEKKWSNELFYRIDEHFEAGGDSLYLNSYLIIFIFMCKIHIHMLL